MTDSGAAAELLRTISRLIEVMEREIEMFRAMKPSEMQGLQEEKIVLTAAYEAKVSALKVAGADTIEPAMREQLLAATKRFQDTMTQNQQALRAARETTDRVLMAIVEEVEKKRGDNAGYSASGTLGVEAAGNRQPVSVAFDQRL